MDIYKVDELEKQIDAIAEANQGEVPETMLYELVQAQTQSLVTLDKMVRYVKNLESYVAACKHEEEQIYINRKKAENRIENIKRYLTPYVYERGKIDLGLFKLSIRKSEYIDVDEDFNNPDYYETKITQVLSKQKIKEAIKSGKEVKGARLKEGHNLQIK